MERVERDRFKWKCRRGMLELDIVLDGFLQRELGGLSKPELAQFDRLLALPDNDLWDVVNGKSDEYPAGLGAMVQRLRTSVVVRD